MTEFAERFNEYFSGSKGPFIKRLYRSIVYGISPDKITNTYSKKEKQNVYNHMLTGVGNDLVRRGTEITRRKLEKTISCGGTKFYVYPQVLKSPEVTAYKLD